MERFIYLVRHGETEFGGEKRYVGHTDCALSAKGIETITNIRKNFSNISIDSVFSSDLLRTRQTAKILFPDIEPVTMEELREINMGKWDGLTFKEVKRKYPDMFEKRIYDIADFVVPGGETFRQCQKRAFAAMEKIISTTTGNIIICGHAGFFRTFIAGLLGMELNDIFEIKQDYGCINVIRVNEHISVEGINVKEL